MVDSALFEGLPVETLAALHRYALNARRKDVQNGKYRRIKLSNALFQRRCWTHPAVRQIMLKSGWREGVEAGCLILPPGETDCKDCDGIVDAVRKVAGHPPLPSAAVSTTASAPAAAATGKTATTAAAAGGYRDDGVLVQGPFSPPRGNAAPDTSAAPASQPPAGAGAGAGAGASAGAGVSAAASAGTAAAAAAAPAQSTADSLAANVQTLCDMGFPDRTKNGQVLQRNGGQIELAINELMGGDGVDGGGAGSSSNAGETDLAMPILPPSPESKQPGQGVSGNANNTAYLPPAHAYPPPGAYKPPSYSAAPPTAPSSLPARSIPPSQMQRMHRPKEMHRWEVQFASPAQSGNAEVQTNCATWAEMERNASTRMPRDFAKQLNCKATEVTVTIIRKIEDN